MCVCVSLSLKNPNRLPFATFGGVFSASRTVSLCVVTAMRLIGQRLEPRESGDRVNGLSIFPGASVCASVSVAGSGGREYVLTSERKTIRFLI